MTVANVVEAIRQGSQGGQEAEEPLGYRWEPEDPEDALQLSFVMAFAIQLFGETPHILEDALDLAGRILCPLFDFAKPAEYRTEMRRVRLQYRGIARESALQREWLDLTIAVAREGSLESVTSAVEAKVWDRLERKERYA